MSIICDVAQQVDIDVPENIKVNYFYTTDGYMNYNDNLLAINKSFVDHHSDEQVKRVIKHELAHFLQHKNGKASLEKPHNKDFYYWETVLQNNSDKFSVSRSTYDNYVDDLFWNNPVLFYICWLFGCLACYEQLEEN